MTNQLLPPGVLHWFLVAALACLVGCEKSGEPAKSPGAATGADAAHRDASDSGSPIADTEATKPPPIWLRDVTAHTGVDFTYRNGEEANRFTILESLGGGVALFDFDRDGRLDVFVVGGGQFEGGSGGTTRGLPGKLLRNMSG